MVDRLQLWPPLLFSSLPLYKSCEIILEEFRCSEERGGWQQPGPLQGQPATAKPPVGVADHNQRPLQRGCRLRLAMANPQLGPHDQAIEAAARRGDTCGHDAHRQAACGHKLLPARAATVGTPVGATPMEVPLAGAMSAAKGRRQWRRCRGGKRG
ncbi:hypothetical protein B296_00019650 [Ensete ventricosum]|uniref:Uncharacterized protein n=1 Tax=Ensete ventricosum TaxID=4639 RepID=A0A426XDT5_ENSVE|nr:hypothetical protein B296_00019650 [Ensete ventricosum]